MYFSKGGASVTTPWDIPKNLYFPLKLVIDQSPHVGG